MPMTLGTIDSGVYNATFSYDDLTLIRMALQEFLERSEPLQVEECKAMLRTINAEWTKRDPIARRGQGIK